MLATCNTAFPVGKVDNLFAAEKHLRALPGLLQAMVTKAIHSGAATALATAQLQIDTTVNLRVAEQGFSPRSTNDDIAYLIESFKPASNAVLWKVDVDEILHANHDP